MSFKLATHLYRNRHGTFYFRFVFPKDLQIFSERRELRFSLHTEQRNHAITHALLFISDIPKLIANLRNMAKDNESPSPNHFKKWIEAVRQNNCLKQRIEELENELEDAQIQMKGMISKDKAIGTVKHAHTLGQLKGKQEIEQRLMFPWPVDKTALFSELKTAYLRSFTYRAEGGIKRPPTEKTIAEYDKSLDFFTKVMSDLKIGEIDKEIAGAYFSILKRLPANISRVKAYRGKGIEEILALKPSPQSEATCSQKMERASTMFKWALTDKRKWGIDTNPFVGFGQDSDNPTTRRPFTPDEIPLCCRRPRVRVSNGRTRSHEKPAALVFRDRCCVLVHPIWAIEPCNRKIDAPPLHPMIVS